ncbi:hypothetical protein PIB30_110632, partial [Stylosanthes scabra]|nr:hypothetical protein [Stylosanthes scabra]
MEEMKKPYGTSILVPSVQELAKQKISSVPQRYVVLPQQHEDLAVSEAHLALEIPVIDFQKLLSTEDRNSKLSNFHLACKDWEFFQ